MLDICVNDAPKSTVWYIGFTSYKGRRRWLQKCLPAGFGHVFALTQLGTGVLCIEPAENGIGFGLMQHPLGAEHFLSADLVAHTWQHKSPAPIHFLKVRNQNALQGFFSQTPTSCVGAIKAILGLKSCAITPKGLYHSLMKCGATSV